MCSMPRPWCSYRQENAVFETRHHACGGFGAESINAFMCPHIRTLAIDLSRSGGSPEAGMKTAYVVGYPPHKL
jgi:hypothetical protein